VRPMNLSRRNTDSIYERRTGRPRPAPLWDDDACAAWRDAHTAAGMTNAWTHTPPRAQVALLVELSRHTALSGTELAVATGISPSHTISNVLPKLRDVGLVHSSRERRESAPPRRGPTRTIWWVTIHGWKLSMIMERGRLT
jgi:hypothetical protein